MPKVRRSRKQPPEGWELIEPTLEELEQKMREGRTFGVKNRKQNVLKMVSSVFPTTPSNSRNGTARGQTHHGVAVAHLQDPPPKVALHLRSVLPAESDQPGTVRVLPEGEDRRRESDCQVEKVRLREPVLPAVHPDAGHQLRDELHLPGAQVEAGGGPRRRVCPLRVPGLFRLRQVACALGTRACV